LQSNGAEANFISHFFLYKSNPTISKLSRQEQELRVNMQNAFEFFFKIASNKFAKRYSLETTESSLKKNKAFSGFTYLGRADRRRRRERGSFLHPYLLGNVAALPRRRGAAVNQRQAAPEEQGFSLLTFRDGRSIRGSQRSTQCPINTPPSQRQSGPQRIRQSYQLSALAP